MLFAAAYGAYQLVRGLVHGNEPLALANAWHIVHLERAVGAFFEPGFQQALLDHRWLIDSANFMYLNSHFVLTTTFLVWLYLARNSAFYFVRNMFVIAMGLALLGYLVYPAAPPRLLPEWGFTDTVTNAVGQGQAQTAKLLFNPYAAMPSMHVGFALMLAVPAFKLVSIRAVRALWTIYPAFVTFVVVVTANHFWIDGALGALVAAVSAYGAYALGRLRPEAWAWRTERDSGPPAGGLGAEAPA